jgi:oligopeptide/dipeptide ABC transporter ATP-binding protein
MDQTVPRELIKLRDLSISFPGKRRTRTVVVDRVSLDIYRDEILGLVGESGSGKTVSSMAVMGLTRYPGKIEAGQIWYDGQNLLHKKEDEMRRLRGRVVSMIFQNPRSSLNPLMRVGDQISRVYRLHRGMGKEQAQREAINMLKLAGITDAERRMRSYPHQLSGGMCQRVMIAIMLASQPQLLIADEPTTGLDVTIQAQIFELIKSLRTRTGMSVLLITHDLGVVAETCNRVAVMHAGHIVEIGQVSAIFHDCRHPYTKRLLGSVLRVDKVIEIPKAQQAVREEILYSSFACRYVNKCELAESICLNVKPPWTEVAPGHTVMCHKSQRHDEAVDQS